MTENCQVRDGEDQGRRLYYERREPALPHVSVAGAPLGRDYHRLRSHGAVVHTVVVDGRQG